MKKVSAFTLIEVILSVSILAMISVMPALVDSGIIFRLQAETAQEQIGHAFRSAQLYSKMSRGNSDWGVRVQSNTVTLFKGSSYASRDSSYDQSVTFDSKTTITVTSGSSEVVFSKMTANASGNMTVSINSNTGISNVVSLTQEGGITYN